MLNAVWSKQHNDMLDLILPFVKYAIGRKYRRYEQDIKTLRAPAACNPVD